MTNQIPLKGIYNSDGSLSCIGEFTPTDIIQDTNLPISNTTNAGIVQLNDTLTSNSTLKAATANAVYTVNVNAANASFLTTGTISTARLGSGTANSTTYLAGNNTWKTIIEGATDISDDTASNSNFYPLFSSTTLGTASAIHTSSSKLFYNPSTGTLTSTAFNSLSDRTLKEDVVLINNAMEVLKLLQPVSFKWKDNGKKSYGLIAQEVEEILPELIETDSNGIKSVNYTAIIPFLINAIVETSK